MKTEHFSVRVQFLKKNFVTFLLCALTLISTVYLFVKKRKKKG